MEENAVILANGFVVTCDAANRAGRFHIAIRDGRIQEIGGLLDVLTTMYPTAAVIDVSDHLIVPGFVNGHYHTESFFLQELTTGKPFSLWKGDRVLRDASQVLTETGSVDHLRSVARASYLAHLKSGTTTIAEFPPLVDAAGLEILLQEAASSGLRSVVVLQTWDQINKLRDERGPRKPVMVGLGREDDYTVYSFENFVRISRELGIPIAGHVAEQREDVEILRRNFTKSPAALYQDFGALLPSTLLTHMNHGTTQDAALIAASRASVVLCAASTASKQCGYPFLRAVADRNVHCCVGTDWGNVNMLEELQFLRKLPRLFTGMPEFSATALLRMSTIEGAAAIGVDDLTGSIETGKHADLTVFSLADIRRTPAQESWTTEEYADLMLRSLSPDAVRHVLARGRFVVRNGALTGVDEKHALASFRRTRDALLGPVSRRTVGSPTFGVTSKARVYAFTPGERRAEGIGEDYVDGFQIKQKAADERPEAPSPPETASAPDRTPSPPPSAPQPPKQVKKVFGEDDVF